MNRGRGVMLIEMLFVVSIIALLIGILLPVLGAARRNARGTQNSVQVRPIHQGLILYSQGNGGWFPGLDALGKPVNLDAPSRMALLIEGNYFTAGYLINPAETNNSIQRWDGKSPITANHWSYAALQAPAEGGRSKEWRNTSNPRALVLGDRAIGATDDANITSIWTIKPGDWRGSVVFNDNSTQFLSTHRVDVDYDGTATKDDNIFEKLGNDDAYVVHEGNE
jgi:type II secretory pathway pseudopilin PulG